MKLIDLDTVASLRSRRQVMKFQLGQLDGGVRCGSTIAVQIVGGCASAANAGLNQSLSGAQSNSLGSLGSLGQDFVAHQRAVQLAQSQVRSTYDDAEMHSAVRYAVVGELKRRVSDIEIALAELGVEVGD